MSRILTVACLFLITAVKAQDLARKIPGDAFAVVNIQTAHFFELISTHDFNATTVGKSIIEKAREAGLGDIQGIDDFGIALDRTSYFYTKLTDSVTYFNFLVPIADINAFEKHFGKDKAIADHGSYKHFNRGLSGDNAFFAWDDHMLTVTIATLVNSYFNQADVAARYGITNYSYYDYYDSMASEAADSAYAYADDAWADVDTAIAEDEAVYDSLDFSVPPPMMPGSLWDDTDSVDGVYGYDEISEADNENPYEEYYAADQAIKQQLSSEWAGMHAEALFGALPDRSILGNSAYLSSLSKDALVSVWIPSFEAIYTTLLPELSEFRSSTGKLFSYYGSFQAGLFADKEGFKLKSTMEVNGSMAKRFKRIYGRKLNRKFLRYLNTDDAIGYFSIAMDTKAYLEELPALMKDTYGGLFAQYEDDINLGAEMVSLILDEAALANVAKGDALFVLNGISEQEVPYISYEYDDDYNYSEIEKTKVETIPDFLFMFSSDDVSLYSRVMGYALRKGFLLEENGVYELTNTELPFGLFVTRRDGIIFIGTAADQFTAIAANRYQAKIDRHTKKLLTKNKTAGLLSAKKLSAEIPTEQLASLDRYIAFNKIFGSMGDFYFASNGIKGNLVSGEFVAQTPEGFDNAVQYLFALVDYATQQ